MLLEIIGFACAIAILSIAIVLLGTYSDVINMFLVEDSEVNEIKLNNIVDLDKSQVHGSDVIGYIRYYKDDISVEVAVTNNNGAKAYTNSTYNESSFKVDYKDVYNIETSYDNKKLKSIKCVLD